MKVIYIEPGASVIQALGNAYFACKDEPITVCANGVRAVFMPDESRYAIEVLEPKQYVDVSISPVAVCTEKATCSQYCVAVCAICNGKDFASCNFYPQSNGKISSSNEVNKNEQ